MEKTLIIQLSCMKIIKNSFRHRKNKIFQNHEKTCLGNIK